MKNLIKSIFVLLLLVFANCIHAQNACEFDTIVSSQAQGFKFIETKSKHLLVAGVFGYSLMTTGGEYLKTFLTKLDPCGNVLWSINPDSTIIEGGLINIVKLTEDSNGNIEIIAYYYCTFIKSSSFPFSDTINEYRFIKLDANGNLIERRKTKETYTNKFKYTYATEKISTNKYMFLNPFDSGNIKSITQLNVFDTLGNLLLKKNMDTTALLQQKMYTLHLKETNTILLTKAENNLVKLITLDTSANVKKSVVINTPNGFNLFQVLLNQTKTELIITSTKIADSSLYVAKYNLEGVLLTDTLLTDTAFKHELLYYVDSATHVFIGKYNYIKLTNSNYKILWKGISENTREKSYDFYYLSVVKSHDNSIVILGNLSSYGGVGKTVKSYFIKKTSIIKYIKTIAILGANSINTQGGLLQLTAAILPTNAANQQVIWSISDTNLATITQTSLVTAKANGTVIVSATAADGGGATAAKTITISNQTVGINEVNLNNQITVYPNPASNKLIIKTTNNLTLDASGLQLQLLDLTDKVIANYNNQTEIDLSATANGMYLLHIQTLNGNLVKQVVVNK
ncbi:MAG: Ig-like domain-containing protein [Candidatus Methylacidiphilales bacterium]